MRKKIIFLVILSLFFLIKPSYAQEQQGISITPSIEHLDLALDAPEYELTYQNNTSFSITLNLSVKDFTELEDSYKVNFLEGNDATNYKYSLSSWISFENNSLRLSPGEKKSVKVFIDKDRITKGGHYASILAEIVQEQENKKINLKAILSSLLFVRASTGKEIEDGKISSFIPLRDNFDFPDTFRLRFENFGNVHVIPYGLIEVFDPLGNLVAKGILNEGSLDALPESIRNYDTKIETLGKVLSPGIYTAKISLHFGKGNIKLYGESKFLSQGSFDFTKIALLIILILVLYFIYKKKRINIKNSQ
ncbi:MAG TPA: hypothetical protein VES68_01365 [Candidatus Sulfotelmatobacter sp.]|nr:hypothetical protein [Candidatus Sulfotelmatobacter sp.]